MFLSNFLLPRSCVLCGTRVDNGGFCDACRADLPWIGSACERCGQPLPAGRHCVECQLHPPPFDKAFAPFLYTFPVDSALKALKFRRQLQYAPAFGGLLPPFLEALFADSDALIPVPLHRRRHALRGFNQATELCRYLHKASGLPMILSVDRIRHTRPQTGLEAAERRRNMKAAFRVRGALHCRHPLIIDDVMTTGETCGHLSEALLEAGSSSVSVLAIARAALP